MQSSLIKATTFSARRIAKLTLNDAPTRNSLSRCMLEALQVEFRRIEADSDIRVVILNADGPVFCSGHNLKELSSNTATENTQLMELCSSVMQDCIVNSTKPVIAQVHGMATAAGCQLVASCDLAYATRNATFATPGVDIGLFCSTPAVPLTRCVSSKPAAAMLLTGEAISAHEAERIGLINKVVKHNDALHQEVFEVATNIASKSPHAIRVGKEFLNRQLEMPLVSAYELASKTMVENMQHSEAKEGIGAFLKKRAPNWDKTID